MIIQEIPFDVVDWDSITEETIQGTEGHGTRKAVQLNKITLAKVTYSKGYIADHWCEKGHIIHVLEGTYIMETKDGERREVEAGQTLHVSDEQNSHRSVTDTGVSLFIIE